MPRAFHCDVVSKWERRSVYLLLSLNSRTNFNISGHCSKVSWKWWSKWSPICKHYGRYSWSNFFLFHTLPISISGWSLGWPSCLIVHFGGKKSLQIIVDHGIPTDECGICVPQQIHAVVSKTVCTIRNKNCFQMTKQEYQSFRLKHIKKKWHCWLLPYEFQKFKHIHTSKVKKHTYNI